jgi:long-chain fatty acid transport protein
MKLIPASVLAALSLLAILPPAAATNGYFAHGYSISQRAMAGAATAMVEDSLVASVNPANGVWVGDALDVGLSVFAPIRDHSASARGDDAGPGIFTISPIEEDRSQRERFYIPGFGYNRRIDERSSWGVAVYGNGGLNTVYTQNTARFGDQIPVFRTECEGSFGGGGVVEGAPPDTAGFCGNGDPTVSVDLIQLFVVPSYSRKIGERFSVGIAPIFAAQQFEAKGLNAFAAFSNSPGRVSDQDKDYSLGYGGRVGVFGMAADWLAVGASYQSRIRMQRFDKYEGLFAERGGFDIPSNWNAGITLLLPGQQRLALDYQRINFNEVDSVGRPLDPNRFVNDCALPRLLASQTGGLVGDAGPSLACLGADTGPGFGWQDVEVFKLGYQVTLGSFVLRAGYSRGENPIPSSEVLFNILAPGVPEEHYTAGLSFRMTPALSLDLALMYARNNPVRGKNPLSNVDASVLELLGGGALPGAVDTSDAFGADPQDQDITLDMRQYELSLGISYRFAAAAR